MGWLYKLIDLFRVPQCIPYSVESRIIRKFFLIAKARPSSAPFLSGDSFRSISDTEYMGGVPDFQPYEVVFCSAYLLKALQDHLDKVRTPFILISHHSDLSVDDSYSELANNKFLIRWFAQNLELKHSKIVPIPIGLEDRWRHNAGVVSDFHLLNSKKIKKIPKILCSFSVSTNPLVRVDALNKLSGLQTVFHFRGDSREYRRTLNRFMFVASPRGNGIDCHRAWEAVYLSTVPIVIDREFYEQFSSYMPCYIIDKWEELESLTEADLINIYTREISKLRKGSELFLDHWRMRIDTLKNTEYSP